MLSMVVSAAAVFPSVKQLQQIWLNAILAREKIHFLINPQHLCQQKYFARARVPKAA
jgi:hypothetical protein